jgi:hypothetical protein
MNERIGSHISLRLGAYYGPEAPAVTGSFSLLMERIGISMSGNLFATASQVCWIVAGVLALLAIVNWWQQVKQRFAFVGYTAFTILLAIGLWALSLGPIFRTAVPGAGKYATVYDNGSANAVIAVSPNITPEQLELALLQATRNLYSTGRYSSESVDLTIRARTVVNPEAGISRPIYLGQARRSLAVREDPNLAIETFPEGFKQLQQFVPADREPPA